MVHYFEWKPMFRLFIVVTLSLSSVAQSVGQGIDRTKPKAILSQLQELFKNDNRILVKQDELDSLIRENGGGACPSAAGIIVLQGLRAMSGMELLDNPHKASLKAFKEHPALLNGRVSNELFCELIRSYEQYFDGRKITMTVSSAPDSNYATSAERWSSDNGPDLSISPNHIKVLSFSVDRRDEGRVGRHFVVLRETNDNKIFVINPKSPAADHSYDIVYREGEGHTKYSTLLALPPEHASDKLIFTLNTIFDVSIEDGSPAETRTIEEVKKGIDDTVDSLRNTDRFRDPREWRKRSAAFGLPGLDLPKRYGGSDWKAVDMIEIFRHAGRYDLNFRDVVGGAHGRALKDSTNPEIQEIVRKVAQGEEYIAITITEPEVGSNIAGIKSTCRRVEGGFLLNGTKRYNARLEQAGHVIIFTQSSTGEPGKLSVFIVPTTAPNLKFEHLTAHGLTGNSYGGVEFKDLFVKESQIIGEDGKGLEVFFHHFLYWRLMQSAAAIGTGEQALDQMAARLKSREAFGARIGRFTHLQQSLGQSATELRMALALAREAAELIDQNNYHDAREIICGLKAEGVEIALRATDSAMRAFGGEGYSTRVDLGDRIRDLMGLRIADGTTDVMRMDVVRERYGEELWKMAIERN